MMFGVMLIIVGIAFLLQNLGYIPEDAWRIIWPAALIAVGLRVIFKRRDHGFFWEEHFGWRKREIEEE